jgi:hypothetical protein
VSTPVGDRCPNQTAQNQQFQDAVNDPAFYP